MNNLSDLIRILKSITVGDILGAIALFGLLYLGLFYVYV